MGSEIKDYTTIRLLCDYLRTLPAATRVNLDAGRARFLRVTFDGDDKQQTHTVYDQNRDCWNVIHFWSGQSSTAGELLGLLGPWEATHAYAGVVLNGDSVLLPAMAKDVTLAVDTGVWYKQTKLNHRRYASVLLTAKAPGNAGYAHRLLAKRFGLDVANATVLYAVDARWYTTTDLLGAYARLSSHSDWLQLFPLCGFGELRRCVVGHDILQREFGAAPKSIVQQLLSEHGGAPAPTLVPTPSATTAAASATADLAASAAVTAAVADADTGSGDAKADVPMTQTPTPAVSLTPTAVQQQPLDAAQGPICASCRCGHTHPST